jgi:hypothetical protein
MSALYKSFEFNTAKSVNKSLDTLPLKWGRMQCIYKRKCSLSTSNLLYALTKIIGAEIITPITLLVFSLVYSSLNSTNSQFIRQFIYYTLWCCNWIWKTQFWANKNSIIFLHFVTNFFVVLDFSWWSAVCICICTSCMKVMYVNMSGMCFTVIYVHIFCTLYEQIPRTSSFAFPAVKRLHSRS